MIELVRKSASATNGGELDSSITQVIPGAKTFTQPIAGRIPFNVRASEGAGTTTLVTDTDLNGQSFSLTAARTVVLPSANVKAGDIWVIQTRTYGFALTIQSSGLNTIATVRYQGYMSVTALIDSPTTAANWFISDNRATPAVTDQYMGKFNAGFASGLSLTSIGGNTLFFDSGTFATAGSFRRYLVTGTLFYNYNNSNGTNMQTAGRMVITSDTGYDISYGPVLHAVSSGLNTVWNWSRIVNGSTSMRIQFGEQNYGGGGYSLSMVQAQYSIVGLD